MSNLNELRIDELNNQALSLGYGVLKAGLRLKEAVQEDKEVLGKLRQTGDDLGVTGKPEGQLSFGQLQFRATVDRFERCIDCMQRLDDRIEEINKELKEIFAECGPTLQRAESYAIKAKYLAERLRAAD